MIQEVFVFAQVKNEGIPKKFDRPELNDTTKGCIGYFIFPFDPFVKLLLFQFMNKVVSPLPNCSGF